MKTVAVTGISGYLGTGVLQRLEKQEEVATIIGIDLREPASFTSKLRFVEWDICKPFGNVLADNKVDCAIHLAFAVRPTHDIRAARKLDIDGAESFIEACQYASVKRMLYLSSYTAYGPHPDNPEFLTEDCQLRPLHGFLYSRDKCEADLLFQNFMRDHPDYCVTIVRASDILGPKGGGSIAAARYPKVMVRLWGYNPRLQYLHEDDLAELLTALILKDQPGIFNAGGDGTITYKEAIDATGRPCVVLPSWLLTPLLKLSWSFKLQAASPPEGLDFIKYSTVVSTDHTKEKTGFQFRHTSKETLMDYLKSQ